jgi:hypothetical protein
MKLSEVKTEGNLKILVYGASGCGKTVFAAGFPYPMLYLDFDQKVDSAALFYKNDKERLEGIDVRQLGETMSVSPIEQLTRIINDELIPQQKSGVMKYKTIVLDSLTTFSSSTLNYIISSNPGVKRVASRQGVQPTISDYGILRREFQKLIPGLLSLPCNVVMLGHIATEKDEVTGQVFRGPHMDGSFARDLPIYFKEAYFASVNDKKEYILQTQSNSTHTCRSQIPGLPNPVKSSYEEVAKYL